MPSRWLSNLGLYYERAYGNVFNPLERHPGHDLKETYRYIPWLHLAVREGSAEGWNYVKHLHTGASPLRLFVKRMLTGIVRLPLLQGFLEKREIPRPSSACPWDIIYYGRGVNRIVLFNLSKKEVLNVSQSVSANKYLWEEIDMREKRHEVVPVPEMIMCDQEGRFFLQRLMEGVPIHRLPDEDMKASIDEVFAALWRYYQSRGVRPVRLADYVKDLSDKILDPARQGLLRYRFINRELMDDVKRVSDMLGEQTILLTKVHGDFHFGNIFKEKDRTYVLDWEHSREMSLYNDWFNLKAFAVKYFGRNPCHPDYRLPHLTDEEIARHRAFLERLVPDVGIYYFLYCLERITLELENESVRKKWLRGWMEDLWYASRNVSKAELEAAA